MGLATLRHAWASGLSLSGHTMPHGFCCDVDVVNVVTRIQNQVSLHEAGIWNQVGFKALFRKPKDYQ